MEQLERDQRTVNESEGKRKNEASRDATKIMNQEAEISYYKEMNNNLKEEIRRMEEKIFEARTHMDSILKERDK